MRFMLIVFIEQSIYVLSFVFTNTGYKLQNLQEPIIHFDSFVN